MSFWSPFRSKDVSETSLQDVETGKLLRNNNNGDDALLPLDSDIAAYGSSWDPFSPFSIHSDPNNNDTASVSTTNNNGDDDAHVIVLCFGTTTFRLPSLRRIALAVSLYVNIAITLAKLVTYIRTLSLSVLAALLDSVLDILSQVVLNYTERHSSMQRSSAFYPAGASRLEPIGVLTCAAFMGMASFEVIKESITALIYDSSALSSGASSDNKDNKPSLSSFYSMLAIVVVKLLLLWICNRGANKRIVYESSSGEILKMPSAKVRSSAKAVVQMADPTIEALAQDHFNDILSNTVAALALLCALRSPQLWFLDPVGGMQIRWIRMATASYDCPCLAHPLTPLSLLLFDTHTHSYCDQHLHYLQLVPDRHGAD